MRDRKTSSGKIDAVVAHSVSFELTVADMARRSERRAWWVALSAIALCLILAGGYYYMLPLKQKVPYLVMADAYTGTSTVARLSNDFSDLRITASEAINRSNVAHYVLARESYDVAIMGLRDWTTVLTMSSPDVGNAYRALYAQNNPNNPYLVYGRERAIRTRILSIVLVDHGPGTPPKGATVRFQRSIYNKQTGATQMLDSKLATMTFTYKSNLKMDDQSRIENPLGFQVTDYRVDSDYNSPPPVEIPTAAAPPAAINAAPAMTSTPAQAATDESLPPSASRPASAAAPPDPAIQNPAPSRAAQMATAGGVHE